MKPRRAVSMIELLLILSACTVFLTLTGMLLQRSMRIQMQSRGRVDAERTALRLVDQFRHDVHQASRVVAGDAGQSKSAFLRLEFANGRSAEYSRAEGSVLRLESGGNKPIRREEFVFPATCVLAIDEEDGPRRVALTITNEQELKMSGGSKPLVSTNFFPVNLHAVAVVGRDLRLAAAPADQEAPE